MKYMVQKGTIIAVLPLYRLAVGCTITN